MDISSGAELVWSLAASEAKFGRFETIEPDHFFCGLLKFAETSDSELTHIAARPSVGSELIDESRRVCALLDEHGISTRRSRHRIRRILGRGDHEHRDDVVHRSQAARDLLNRAARAVGRGEKLEAAHILETLLADPTDAMSQVLDAKAETRIREESEPFVEELLEADPYVRDLGGMAGAIPEWCMPQVKVLGEVLGTIESRSALLICASGHPVIDVLGAAEGSDSGGSALSQIDVAALEKDNPEMDVFAGKLKDLLAAEPEDGPSTKFIALRSLSTEASQTCLTVLATVVSGAEPVPLILAVDEGAEGHDLLNSPPLSHMLRRIWLHRLDNLKVPDLL
jgi:hypothetical protein